MDALTAALLCVALGSVVYLLWQRAADSRKYPPGPSTLPLLGNLHQIIKAGSMVNFLEENRKIYGNVFTIKFGGFCRVVISSYSLMQELFVKNAENTSDRMTNMFSNDYSALLRLSPGMMWASFPHWKNMRTFALNVLREEGMGKSCLEPQILEEAHAFMTECIEPQEGKPINISDSLTMATSNVISIMALGRRFSYEDQMFQKLTKAVRTHMSGSFRAGLTKNLPLIKYLPGDLFLNRKATEAFSTICECINKFISEHKAVLDKESPKDYIDHYLIHMDKEQRADPNTYFSEGNLVVSTFQLFIAGTDTTSTALRWGLLYMCLQPDAQAKVHREIDSVIGTERPPAYKDRLHMPYTDAVFLEVLRITNIANLGVPRKLKEDMMIDGKLVPGGSELIMNMSSVMFDAETFDEPRKFKPERFLGEGTATRHQMFPFGLGRRICPGESLAKMEFFLFFISILQKYSVSMQYTAEPVRAPLISIIHSPQPFEIVFTPRDLVSAEK